MLEQLLDQLLKGRLQLGDKLPSETELARQLGSGRNSVREAVKVLEVLGIIERRQGSGSYVASEVTLPMMPLLFSLISVMGSVGDMVVLRRVLEIGVIDFVIDRIDADGITRLQQTIDELRRRSQRGEEPERLAESDLAFHIALLEMTDDRAVVELMRLIMHLFTPSVVEHLSTADGQRRAIADHTEILQAVAEGNRERARTAIIRSYSAWRDHIRIPHRSTPD